MSELPQVFGYTPEMNKRYAALEHFATLFINLVSPYSNIKYLNEDCISYWIQNTVYTYDDENNSNYDFIINSLNKYCDENKYKEISKTDREKIQNLLSDFKQYKPLYLEENISEKLKIEEQKPKDDWVNIKIDRDFISSEYVAKEKEFCYITFPETSPYYGFKFSLPKKLIYQTELETYISTTPNYVHTISRYNNDAQKLERFSVDTATINKQYSDYYNKLINDPPTSLQRIREEYSKTGFLDMDKLQNNILFNQYQRLELWQAYRDKMDLIELLNSSISFEKLDEIINGYKSNLIVKERGIEIEYHPTLITENYIVYINAGEDILVKDRISSELLSKEEGYKKYYELMDDINQDKETPLLAKEMLFEKWQDYNCISDEDEEDIEIE